MAKVIVERPRYGSRGRGKPKGYRKQLQKHSIEGLPRRQGMRRRWQGNLKWFNEHLGPLRRYLDSQVGRPWAKVFAEICEHLRRDSVIQDHVRDHVEDYVATDVILIDGVPCHGRGYARMYGEPLGWWGRGQWYVCPRTGLLKRAEAVKRRGRPAPEPPKFVRVSDTQQCRRIDGAWHLVELRPLSVAGKGSRHRDVLLNRLAANIDPEKAQVDYGAPVFAIAVRRLPRGELRNYPIPRDEWT